MKNNTAKCIDFNLVPPKEECFFTISNRRVLFFVESHAGLCETLTETVGRSPFAQENTILKKMLNIIHQTLFVGEVFGSSASF